MIFGMSIHTYTIIHTVISLIGIVTGLYVLYGMIMGKPRDVWTPVFLVSTVLTSVTGFGFPFTQFLPSHTVGIISLVVLAAAIAGLYLFALGGVWRWIYLAGAVFALYLNCFVGVVQAFMKIPALKALAPTQAEGPFLTAQFLLVVLFIVAGVFAGFRFRPQPAV